MANLLEAPKPRYELFERLKFDRPHPAVLRITIASGLKLNAMDKRTHHEVSEIWRDVENDPTVACAIITGDGGSFSAGGDLNEEINLLGDFDALSQTMTEARNIVYGMMECSKPIVSAVRGWAVGGGLVCALMADISVVAKNARISDGHSKIGVVAGDHAALIWPLLCGMARAKYYLLLCEPLTGELAYELGLVSLAVDEDLVADKALELAVRLAEGPPRAVRGTKYVLNHWLRQAAPIFDTSLALEFMGLMGPEAREGFEAFLQKRKPRFPGLN